MPYSIFLEHRIRRLECLTLIFIRAHVYTGDLPETTYMSYTGKISCRFTMDNSVGYGEFSYTFCNTRKDRRLLEKDDGLLEKDDGLLEKDDGL